MTQPMSEPRPARREAHQPARSPAASPPRHLRVLEPRRRAVARRRRRARLMLVSIAALAVAVVFALVYLHVVLAEKQLRLDALNVKAAQEQATYQELRLQVTRLESPAHIVSTAEGKLGMRPPKSVTYLQASKGPRPAETPAKRSGGARLAPAGDANWPLIKSQLAGSP